MSLPDQPVRGRCRYSASVTFVLAADSLDEAYRMQKQIAEVVRAHTNERVTDVLGSMLDLKHLPDLDGSLRTDRPALDDQHVRSGPGDPNRTYDAQEGTNVE